MKKSGLRILSSVPYRSHFAEPVGRVTLQNMESDPKTKPDSLTKEATAIAGGSAIVMVGGIGERAVRMVTTWFLSGALGASGFGLYAFATTVASIVGALAPLGMDAGLIMYGARYRASDEKSRLKGTLFIALGTVAISGPLFAVATWLAVENGLVLQGRPAEAKAITAISAAIAYMAVLAVLVGALVSRKDMVGQAWAQQITVPVVTLVGAGVAILTGQGTRGVITAFVLAHLVAVIIASKRFWSADGDLIKNASIEPVTEPRALFSYALPQSFARVLYRANLWVDILMLTALSSLVDVGVYRVSVALAMLGALPVMASTTMFGPVIAELVYTEQISKLNALLKIVTRWLLVIAAPLYFVVLLLPDVVLSIFDPAYQSGANALLILMAGQAIYVAAAPTGAILTNAGHSTLNLINGLIAVALNIGLNAWLIPDLGILGAAIASATALSVWSMLRVVQVWRLHRCSPISTKSMVLMGLVLVTGTGTKIMLTGFGAWSRVGAVSLIVATGLLLFWQFGRTTEDDAIIDRFKARFGRR